MVFTQERSERRFVEHQAAVEPTSDKATFEVLIAGLPLKLRSSHDAQTVQELIALVDDRVQKALSGNSNISFQKALLLASLHIAEDLLFLKRSAVGELDNLEQRAKEILRGLESTPITRMHTDS